jgi:FtsP/CotA-like multicopper oxidase with cupredoxin domain
MGFFKRLLDFTIYFILQTPNSPDESQIPFLPPVSDSPQVPQLDQNFEAHNALVASQCDIGKSKGCVNRPGSRGCWFDGYNIMTDYEQFVPPGRTRTYELTLSDAPCQPDGYKTDCLLINGQYPGPTITADWGDTIQVTVNNNLTNHNGTSIHWHGMRQYFTNWEDGVAGVTQCPIKPKSSQVYEFRAAQYGTSWYHSHFSLQYPDGILGALNINGPTCLNYDEQIDPILISDWYHEDAFSLYDNELAGHVNIPDSYLMNGKGVYLCNHLTDPRCTGEQPRHEIFFKKGRTYKLSIVNTAVATQFTFWIDGHNFTVVQTDFVPILPYETDTVNIGIGQRYDIIVKANASFDLGTNFWINARDCNNPALPSQLGIIRYDKSSHVLPFTPPPDLRRIAYGCKDEDGKDLVPVVPRQVGNNVNSMTPADYLAVGLQGFPDASNFSSPFHKWIIANSSFLIDWDEPTLRRIAIEGDVSLSSIPPSYAPITLNFTTGEWVYFLIIGNDTLPPNTPRQIIPVAHPIHLHGHDFVILASSNTTLDPKNLPKPNLDNPTRRDVAMLPKGGYLWIAFIVDNPGTWLMHCHIAWHASSGLALQYVEQPDRIPELVKQAGITPEFERRCDSWEKYYDSVNIPDNNTQEDSGI